MISSQTRKRRHGRTSSWKQAALSVMQWFYVRVKMRKGEGWVQETREVTETGRTEEEMRLNLLYSSPNWILWYIPYCIIKVALRGWCLFTIMIISSCESLLRVLRIPHPAASSSFLRSVPSHPPPTFLAPFFNSSPRIYRSQYSREAIQLRALKSKSPPN